MRLTFILAFIFLVATFTADAARKKSPKRSGRQSGRTTVISCRVFRKGVCKKTTRNIILVNKSISSSHKCQQFCYATPGCAAFTHFEQSKKEDRKCVLFRDCNGKLSSCSNCISGPIMPRITECLAARQEVAPEPEESVAETEIDGENVDETVNEVIDYDEYVGDSDYDYQIDEDEDYFSEGSGAQEEQSDTEYVDVEDETYDYEDYGEVSNPVDLPLDESGIDEPEEEEEEVDINIDEGFLTDSAGNTVDIPNAEEVEVEQRFGGSPDPAPVNSAPGGGNTFIFFFCALGGHNAGGPVSLVDMLQTGLGNAAQSLSIAPVPAAVMRGGEVSSAYTDGRITTCGNGWTILSPYGYIYKPGVCYDYNIQNSGWETTGAELTSFRKGATITKLGRYLLATGGVKEKKSLRTVEAFDPKKPKQGWKKLEKLQMPAAVSQHCTVTMDGRKGKEVVITGGRGRETRALKLDVKSQRWYSLNRMTIGRRKHACVKARINGRPGLVVSGGSGRGNKNMTSVEFFDAKTGEWLSLPPLNRGRRSHVMTVTKGKLLVAGGEGVTRAGKQYLDSVEVFTGKGWVTGRQKLDRPRSNFSLVKVPQRQGKQLRRTNSNKAGRRRSMKNRKSNNNKTKYRSRNPKTNF